MNIVLITIYVIYVVSNGGLPSHLGDFLKFLPGYMCFNSFDFAYRIFTVCVVADLQFVACRCPKISASFFL